MTKICFFTISALDSLTWLQISSNSPSSNTYVLKHCFRDSHDVPENIENNYEHWNHLEKVPLVVQFLRPHRKNSFKYTDKVTAGSVRRPGQMQTGYWCSPSSAESLKLAPHYHCQFSNNELSLHAYMIWWKITYTLISVHFFIHSNRHQTFIECMPLLFLKIRLLYVTYCDCLHLRFASQTFQSLLRVSTEVSIMKCP